MSPGYPCCPGCQGGPSCSNCDSGTTPGSVTATFGTGTNSNGNASGCDQGGGEDCDEFAAAWELPQLSQAEVDSLNSSCSAAFTPESPTAGCYYGLSEGLPCGCNAMILEITDGGTAGAGEAQGALTMCFDSNQIRLDWSIDTDDSDQDCVTNIDTSGGGVDDIRNHSATGGDNPCDFINVLFDFTLLDLVANA